MRCKRKTENTKLDHKNKKFDHENKNVDHKRGINQRSNAKRLQISGRLRLSGSLVFVLLLIAIFGGFFLPYDPYKQDLSNTKARPSASHILGTDRFGRDTFSRIILGARTSILSTLFLVFLIMIIGTTIGLLAAWYGKWLDSLLMRISDLFLAFPGLVFALAIAALLGGGTFHAVLSLALISWPKYARLARSKTLSEKQNLYLDAARLSGDSTAGILFGHILPNIAGSILVTAVLDIGTMLMEIAGLSFLGLGAKPPIPEWGSMMNDSRNLLATAPWVTLAPGFAIVICVAVFRFFGDALRDFLEIGHP
ncbi:MAG: ABC transporter permease [Lachnospiraceae bacterium]|nr:ABC transporter permease [Lachnospiraceae bacterium]